MTNDLFISLWDIKECFTEVKQVFLLYLWDSLVTLELISLIPLVGPLLTDPLAVKLLHNRLYIQLDVVEVWWTKVADIFHHFLLPCVFTAIRCTLFCKIQIPQAEECCKNKSFCSPKFKLDQSPWPNRNWESYKHET